MYRNTLTVGISILLMAASIACGGKTPTSPSSVTPVPVKEPKTDPTPSPPTPAPEPGPAPTPAPDSFTRVLTGVVGAGDGGGEEEDDWVKRLDFVVPRDGVATLTLDWGNAAIDLDLSLTDAACTYLYAADSRDLTDNCERYENTDNSRAEPERISRTVKAGEAYRIWLTNWAETNSPQNYRLEIDIR